MKNRLDYAHEWWHSKGKFIDRKKYHSSYREANRTLINNKNAVLRPIYAEAFKESVINMYSNGDACCKWCGQADVDVLQIDHINDDGAWHRGKWDKFMRGPMGGTRWYGWLRKHDYPGGLQILCANCNMKKESLRRRTLRDTVTDLSMGKEKK
jgi:hypothetical protein